MSEVRRERILLFVIGEGFRCLLSALLQRGKVAFQVFYLPLFFINPLLLRFEFRLTSMRVGVVRVGINCVLVQRKHALLQVQIYFLSGDSCLHHVDFNIFLRSFTVRNWRLRRGDRCCVSGFRTGHGARAGSCCRKRGSAAHIEALLTGPEVLPVQVIVANHSGTPHEVLLLFAVTPGSVRNGSILLRYILCLSINATRNHSASHEQGHVEMKAPTVSHSRLSVAAPRHNYLVVPRSAHAIDRSRCARSGGIFEATWSFRYHRSWPIRAAHDCARCVKRRRRPKVDDKPGILGRAFPCNGSTYSQAENCIFLDSGNTWCGRRPTTSLPLDIDPAGIGT